MTATVDDLVRSVAKEHGVDPDRLAALEASERDEDGFPKVEQTNMMEYFAIQALDSARREESESRAVRRGRLTPAEDVLLDHLAEVMGQSERIEDAVIVTFRGKTFTVSVEEDQG